MTTERTRYNLTSADTKIIGTDYQFFYFINQLMKLEKGQHLGYEVKDDVHIDLPGNKTVLIQLKHTTQRQANGQPINLTELDDDLLHTIDNWILVICDKNDGRDTIEKQKNFIKNTSFVLATNKPIDKNPFVENLTKANRSTKEFNNFIDYLKGLLKTCKGTTSKACISNMLEMKRDLFKSFIGAVNIKVRADSIIEGIIENIAQKYVRAEKINDVFSDIFFELKVSFFNKINSGEKYIISYEDWLPRGISIFERYQTTNLPIRVFQKALPDKLHEQPFIKELIDIGDIDKEEIEQIAEYTDFMLAVEMNLKEWYDNGEITMQQRILFHEQAKTQWKNIHKKYHRKTNLVNDIDNGLKCLDEIRNIMLKFERVDFDIQLSNGEFYHLSNNREIGWVKLWEDKYRR